MTIKITRVIDGKFHEGQYYQALISDTCSGSFSLFNKMTGGPIMTRIGLDRAPSACASAAEELLELAWVFYKKTHP